MTRANGIVLLPTLPVEAGYQFWKTKRWDWRWTWIALVPLGFAVYLLIKWHVTGDPFAGFRMRSQMSYTSFDWSWRGIRGAIGIMIGWKPGDAEIVGAPGIHFRDDELDQAAPDLRDVYHCELADIRQYHVHGKHAALHADDVPDFYSVRAPWRKSVLARCDYRLVAPFLALFTSLFTRGGWAF